MFAAYVIVNILAVTVNTYAFTIDFLRTEAAVKNVVNVGFSESWLFTLGTLKAAGVAGLLLGFVVPWIGIAAATGLVLFFLGAISAHIRAQWFAALPFPVTYLTLAAGSLVLRLATA